MSPSTENKNSDNNQPTLIKDWDVLSSLILVQAIHTHGEENWTTVSKILKSHPCLKNFDSELFSVNNCSAKFVKLINDVNSSSSEKDAASMITSNAQDNNNTLSALLRIGKKLHEQRVLELTTSLKEEEKKILKLLDEIKEIESGEWDQEIKKIIDQGKRQSLSQPQKPNESKALANNTTPSEMITLAEDAMEVDDQNIDQQEQQEEQNQQQEQINEEEGIVPMATEEQEDTEFGMMLENNEKVYQNEKRASRLKKAESNLEVKKSPVEKKEWNDSMSNIDNNSELEDSINEDKKKDSNSLKVWKKTAMVLWNKLSDHRYAAIFMNPVKEDDAPDYYTIIKQPICLSQIKNKIKDGEVINTSQLNRYLLLMIANAIIYNGEESELFTMAIDFKEYAEQEFRNIFYHDSVLRRKSISIPTENTDD